MTAQHIHDALTLLPADLIAEADKKRSHPPRIIPWGRYAAMAACFALVLCSSWFCMKLFAPKGSTEAVMEAPAAAEPMEQEAYRSRGLDTTLETQATSVSKAFDEMEEGLCGLPAAPASGESAAEDVQSNTTADTGGSGTIYEGMSQPRYVEAMPGASTTACFIGNPVPELFHSPADLEAYRDKPIQRFDPSHLLENCTDYDEGWFEDHDLLLISLCSVPDGEVPEVTSVYEQDGQWYFCFPGYLESTEAQRKDWHILIETQKDLIPSANAITLVFE